MAVARLRWLEELGRDPTPDEERSAPGCQWAVKNHAAMFCFFKLMEGAEEPFTEAQVAHMLSISESVVKKTREAAIKKMAEHETFEEMKELYAGEPIVVEREIDPYETQYNDWSSKESVSEVLEEVAEKSDSMSESEG